MIYQVLKNIPNHNNIQNQVTLELWSEFILHDPVSNKYWGTLFESFGEYQFSLESDGEIIGTGNCLPFRWDDDIEALPEGGWDEVLEKAVKDNAEKASLALITEEGSSMAMKFSQAALNVANAILTLEDPA